MAFFPHAFSRYAAAACVVLLAQCQPKTDDTTGPNPSDTTGTVAGDVDVWVTHPDQSALLYHQPQPLAFKTTADSSLPTIRIDTTQRFQTMDGFGLTFTGGSAHVIGQLDAAKRNALMRELFLPDSGIGISYLRLSIGASDLNDRAFTYDDLPAGQTDPNMERFSLDPDREELIPLLKQVKELNPDIKFMGSPWTAPVWMKTNNNTSGGSLKPEHYAAYAKYFVKYVQEMEKEGLPIDAITIQNEPENPNNNPSLVMTAEEQADFVKNHLGPAFRDANISTKIVVFDHNCDHPNYPISILNDPDAKQYVDGSAFHLYLGNISALTQVHDAHPDKNVYFTEQWTGSNSSFADDLNWHIREVVIGSTRNWAKTVLEWNLANNAQYEPHTPGGCTQCKGALTIDGGEITRNVMYYNVAHGSKFARPGSVRVGSNVPDQLPNVAFVTPDGKKVLIVLNDSGAMTRFNIQAGDQIVTPQLQAGAVATFVW
ncbi:glucosylceramidase [Catalinimonas alkaloidigena]|uniref:Glucosylceramidase n=1 Tax=Catalinimonas alkaloidigena TaxID=1075417 RepID=A0A1G9IU01_9BACT|nr:glycoside hydrolase family 30 beta sandwich domain-containing protein [Catalinimonas alkaloidigena]SDL28536.1 glucosylceramidase [Catalinimonas alkaloidigena]